MINVSSLCQDLEKVLHVLGFILETAETPFEYLSPA